MITRKPHVIPSCGLAGILLAFLAFLSGCQPESSKVAAIPGMILPALPVEPSAPWLGIREDAAGLFEKVLRLNGPKPAGGEVSPILLRSRQDEPFQLQLLRGDQRMAEDCIPFCSVELDDPSLEGLKECSVSVAMSANAAGQVRLQVREVETGRQLAVRVRPFSSRPAEKTPTDPAG